MITVNKYKIWCEDEQAYVYSWGETTPTACPTDAAHIIGEVKIDASVSELVPVDPLSGGMRIDQMQHPYGWTYQRRGFLITLPAGTSSVYDGYYQIKDGSGSAMQYRAITGGYITENAQSGDKFDISLVVKGSDLGGVDGVHDLELYSMTFEEFPVNDIRYPFFSPDRSMLIYATADSFNPALPAAPVYFRVRYTPVGDGPLPVDVHCWLEGFQPPAV